MILISVYIAMQDTLLSNVPVGKHIRVNAIQGGKSMVRKLLSLGISLGSEFEIINQRGDGIVLADQTVCIARLILPFLISGLQEISHPFGNPIEEGSPTPSPEWHLLSAIHP